MIPVRSASSRRLTPTGRAATSLFSSPQHSYRKSYPATVTKAAPRFRAASIFNFSSSSSSPLTNSLKKQAVAAAMASTNAADQSKSDSGDKITNLLQSALKEASPNAQATADSIDKLFRDQQAAGGDAEEFIWSLWTLYIEIAKKVPASDTRQAFLVDVLVKLKAKKGDPVEIWGQKANMWDDLALFGPCMREAWNLTVKHDGSEDDKARVQEWISLNAFAARILGAKLQSWMNFAIWELRAGLEEPLTSASAKDLHLATASAWLTHAGKALHTEAALGVKPEGQEAKILQGGSLIKDVTGNTTERWQFWKKRLAELAPEASSADVKAQVQEATTEMAKHEAE